MIAIELLSDARCGGSASVLNRVAELTLALAVALAPLAAVASDIELARIDAAASTTMPRGVELVADYGSFAVVRGADSALANLGGAQRLDGGYDLALPGMTPADPLRAPPVSKAVDSRLPKNEKTFGLVQFDGPIKPQWREALEDRDIDAFQYVHPYAYIVWASRSALAAARADATGVRFAGLYPDAARMQFPAERRAGRSIERVRLMVLRSAGFDRGALATVGAELEGDAMIDQVFDDVIVRIPADRIDALLGLRGVLSVQDLPADGGTRGELSNQQFAGNVDAANQPLTGFRNWLQSYGLTGAGVRLANVDTGVSDTHPDLIGRMVACTGSTCSATASSHGSHTAATMAGDGSSGILDSRGFLRGLGVAPGANLIEQIYTPTFAQAGGMLTLMRQSTENNTVLSSNSWGPAGSPRGYDADTRQVDVGVRDANVTLAGDQPLLFVLSIMNGNGGVSSQGTPDEAKNTLTVGSSNSQSSTGAPLATWQSISPNSGHGPALDGRLIPHVIAPGCRVDSVVSATGFGLNCGTSMATPHVSGAAGLFVEGHRARAGGANPSPALTKAHFVASTVDLFGGTNANGGALARRPNPQQGWGALRLDLALDALSTSFWHDQTQVFTATGQVWSQTLEARDPTRPVRIVLAWTDAPGPGTCASATCTTPSWNNDLDLEVTRGPMPRLGNVFGTDGWSTGGGVNDARNNLEGVMLPPNSLAGPFTVRVRASNINSDALPNSTGALQQDFALVCVNCRAVTLPETEFLLRDGFEG